MTDHKSLNSYQEIWTWSWPDDAQQPGTERERQRHQRPRPACMNAVRTLGHCVTDSMRTPMSRCIAGHSHPWRGPVRCGHL